MFTLVVIFSTISINNVETSDFLLSQLALIFVEWQNVISALSVVYLQSSISKVQLVDVSSAGKLLGALGTVLGV